MVLVRCDGSLHDMTETLLAGMLSHISLGYGTYANSIVPDVTPQDAASHLGLFCLQRGFSSKIYMKY